MNYTYRDMHDTYLQKCVPLYLKSFCKEKYKKIKSSKNKNKLPRAQIISIKVQNIIKTNLNSSMFLVVVQS